MPLPGGPTPWVHKPRGLVFVDQPPRTSRRRTPPSSRRREQRWIIEWIRGPQVEGEGARLRPGSETSLRRSAQSEESELLRLERRVGDRRRSRKQVATPRGTPHVSAAESSGLTPSQIEKALPPLARMLWPVIQPA